jgi:RNA polymerase sigma-70 factor (ECF subfamily)
MLTLPKEQRTVILLRALEHMEYSEIAAMLSLKESTVRWHMHEARRVLRQTLCKTFDLEAFGDE